LSGSLLTLLAKIRQSSFIMTVEFFFLRILYFLFSCVVSCANILECGGCGCVVVALCCGLIVLLGRVGGIRSKMPPALCFLPPILANQNRAFLVVRVLAYNMPALGYQVFCLHIDITDLIG
jgi:hypothetical protein